MEYKRLIQLDNQYPNLRNYKPGNSNNTGVLYGLYPEKNKIDFTFPDINTLKFVAGTNFRFILVIRKDNKDTNPEIYTSETYYTDLGYSIAENNPYFSLASFNSRYIVNITYSDLITTFKNAQSKEHADGVIMNRNLFLNKDSSIDYDSLVAYVDWLVSAVDPLNIDTGGVIPPQIVGDWNYLEIDPISQVVSDKVVAVPTSIITGTSGSAQIDTTSTNTPANKANQTQNVISQNGVLLNNVGQIAAAAGAASALVAGIKSLAGNIPKSLPSVPNLPSISNVTDLVPKVSLPQVPKLPKVSDIPKLPSLKLPPVPKFNPKVPKVPNKFKKGLAGLKEAASSAQGAVASAQSSVNSAVSQAQGAVASAQSKVAEIQKNIPTPPKIG